MMPWNGHHGTDNGAVTPERAQVLEAVARHLASRELDHPVRVGVDGVCGVGKTTFTRELVETLRATGREVVHVDSDGFHHVRERRRRQGAMSARGYYEDAYDFDALVKRVLAPLGPGGCGEYAVRVHDLATDEVIGTETATAPADAIVVFDATFVQRGALREHWDEVVFLDADPLVATSRGVARDSGAMGGETAARAAYESRYAAACAIYLAEEEPADKATVVVQHDDPASPRITRLG
jgi:uridine kinase